MTTEALSTPTDAPASDDGDRLAAALDAASGLDSEAPAEQPPEAAPAAEEPPVDDLEAIAAKAAQRRAEREAAERQHAEKTRSERELELRLAEIDALKELARRDPIAFLEKTGQDPLKAYEELTRRNLKGETGAKVEDQLAAAMAKIAALEERLENGDKTRQQQAQQQAVAAEEQRFLSEVRSDAFPLLAAYEDDVLLLEGYKLARLYNEAAEPYDNARIARVLNARLAERLGSRGVGGTGAAQAKQVNGDRPGSAIGAPPRTITNGLASQSATPQDDDSEDARMRRAMRVAEQQGL